MSTMWARCDKGCPDPYDCPDQPPSSVRCPESRHEGEWRNHGSCKVIGPHEIHNDGHGTRWWPAEDTEDQEATNG